MAENINDFLSVVILLSVPVYLLVHLTFRKLKSIQVKKKEETGKYYPEW